MKPLLSLKDVNVSFKVGNSFIKAVNGVSLDIYNNEVVAIIGETGCGKSVLGNSILKLLPSNSLVSGKIEFKGKSLFDMSDEEFRQIRGKNISVIPQNPASSLDPLMKIGKQVEEALLVHNMENENKSTIENRVRNMFKKLKLNKVDNYYDQYPEELSGGMRQRVLVSMGSITHPDLMIIDEPTKGLDWYIRKDVIDIFNHLKKEMNCTMFLITHDIGVAYKVADKIAVMYCGEILEYGDMEEVLQNPKHPYTKGLINSMPSRGFKSMKGFSPALNNIPKGCKFNPRCPNVNKKCMLKHPKIINLKDGHQVRCLQYENYSLDKQYSTKENTYDIKSI